MPEGILAEATARLAAAGCDTPRLDAELLLAEALGCDRAALVMRAPDRAPRGFEQLLERRAAREPVAYIVGHKAFRRLTLQVDPRVLIPRPETELLVEVGLQLSAGTRVVDVGTGSGAVALALKDERPDLRVIGTDFDQGALDVARCNGARLGLQVKFVCGDLLAGVEADAVLANLPYVGSSEALPPDVAQYEPGAALFAGEDGLLMLRRFINVLPDRVRLAAFEVAPHQAGWLSDELGPKGFSAEIVRDLAGFDRVVVGRR